MAAIFPLIQQLYNPMSDEIVTLSNAKSGDGTPLDNTMAAPTISIWTGGFQSTSVVSGVAMTYSGTPGTFTYTPLAANFPFGLILYVWVQIVDLAAGLHWTQPLILTPIV